ncbi:hypothetical protein [Endomicrobium proavitum]|uniref:Uncharacterized protein n=1 Tax=Endomicrobium proavitum TaxID=1408281 RepID=A0A0G3WGV5_9BACT|nr:hypothetical protein [Endomicrobium proavitum]AKL97553.1 hypothetical protein Epro_0174 [Endomicrobium proavitum]
MALTQAQLAQAVATSKIGRYELVKLALEWVEVKKYDEEYRKLSQAELISKVLDDVVEGVATSAAIEELKKKNKTRENKAAAEEGGAASEAKA